MCPPVRIDNPRALASVINRKDGQTMLYLTCSMMTSIDLAHYGGNGFGYIRGVLQENILSIPYSQNHMKYGYIYNRPSLSRLRLSRITVYLKEKI